MRKILKYELDVLVCLVFISKCMLDQPNSIVFPSPPWLSRINSWTRPTPFILLNEYRSNLLLKKTFRSIFHQFFFCFFFFCLFLRNSLTENKSIYFLY